MKNVLVRNLAAFIAIVFFTGTANAQIVDCNVFMQANHLEVGINQNGAFGTSVSAPLGYHADVYDTMYNPCTGSFSVPLALGFVADPSMTGWTIYYGDYIAPGTPNEGWGISDNSGTGFAYASYYHVTGASGFSGPLTGMNTSYALSGSVLNGVWTGQLTSDSLNVVQTTTIDTGNLYLLQHILFYNSGSTTIDSFFYLRTVDPHNDEVYSGIPATLNKIEDQLPNLSNLTQVSATGTSDTSAYMALATKDSRARGFIIKHSALPPAGTFASIYYGDTVNYMYNAADTLTEDGGIGLIFRIGLLGPGDSITIDFGYSFKGGVIDSVLIKDTISIPPLITPNVSKTNNIAVYPNPATNLVNVSGVAQAGYITICDVVGRTVEQMSLAGNKDVNTVSISNLNPGIYILLVKDNTGNVLTRVPLRKN